MRLPWKKACLLWAGLTLAWLVSGCSAAVSAESLFTLPQLPIEYTDLSRQIDELIADGYEYASPIGGRNIQSVQMVDLDGDGDEEAVAFFRRSNDEKPLKILVFRANGDTYERLSTIESSGTAVDSVYYEDLNGDGRRELVVGWKISSDVQTVAVYSVEKKEPVTLMQSSYVRYSIEELDGDGVPSLLVFRTKEDGSSVAEFYGRKEEGMEVSFSTNLSSTMAQMNRGSVVAGRLDKKRTAVFVTGVTEKNKAITDILTYQEGIGLVNVALNEQTGSSGVIYEYMQLRPQDINGDGLIEIPVPLASQKNCVQWLQYGEHDWGEAVMNTYHDISAGWYFILPADWDPNSISVPENETAVNTNELQTTLLLDDRPAVSLYTLTGENRENRAMRGSRQVLKRQTGTIYAGEIYMYGRNNGLTDELLRQNFKLVMNQWLSS